MRPALEHWLNHNISVAEAIVARIILAARAREASRAAQAEVTRKTATSRRSTLPGKLTDCARKDATRRSCSSSRATPPAAPPSRDAIGNRQAILPLRGKVLNTESAALAKVLD